MALVMAEVFSLPSDHIQPDKKPSPGASRPFNSQLSCQRLKDLGIAKHCQFKSKILDVLKPYYKTWFYFYFDTVRKYCKVFFMQIMWLGGYLKSKNSHNKI